MSEAPSMEPFEPMIGAAKRDAGNRIDELRARRAASSSGWLALQMAEHWNGASTIAVFKPDEVPGNDFSIAIDGRVQEHAAGPGFVVALLREPTLAIEVYSDGTRIPIELVRL
ncbi:hypothetical protein AB0301_08750 [Microbacterium profundi]|uniref:Uncharacterized protein n=1 Tax=Microbacterium profundi TaxID=450380 RepID=A0ABV3LH32_9MICO|nr:glycosyltransferase family 49 protein [Microbacterium profundi]MCE7483084.1 glycosyltransferase family 49 protein [Microbacterium profundi]